MKTTEEMTAQEIAIELIVAERNRQDEKRGNPRHSDFVWNTILSEEVGEVAHEVLNPAPYSLREEVVQVAAVAMAWIEMIVDQENASAQDTE